MRLHCFTEQELDEYQAFIDKCEYASPYHNKAWGLAVSRAYHFNMHYFGLFDDETLTAVMPAVLMKKPTGKASLCTLPYCDLGGVIALDEAASSLLLADITQYANNKNWQFEYRASQDPTTNEDHGNQDINEHFEDGAKVRMLFELLDDVEAQMASFKPKLRSQIKKAVKNGVSARVISHPTEQEIDDFYSVFSVNMRDLGSPVHAKTWFSEIFAQYDNQAFLVLTDFDEQCVGGGIVIHTKNKAVIPWASTLRNYNNKSPNMLLYWEVLSEVIKRGISNFDFGRSTFNEGTYRFKKQWGAVPQKLTWKTLVEGTLVEETPSEKSALRESVEKIWQKMPVGVSAYIGPKIRKYISL